MSWETRCAVGGRRDSVVAYPPADLDLLAVLGTRDTRGTWAIDRAVFAVTGLVFRPHMDRQHNADDSVPMSADYLRHAMPGRGAPTYYTGWRRAA